MKKYLSRHLLKPTGIFLIMFVSAYFLVYAGNVQAEVEPNLEINFKDVPVDQPSWYGGWFYNELYDLARRGIVTGDAEGNFLPQYSINRAEIAAILDRLLEYLIKPEYEELYKNGDQVDFSDLPDNEWFYDSVNHLSAIGVIKGYNDGTFRPYESATRSETAVMIKRVFDILPAIGEVPVSEVESPAELSDVKKGLWYSEAVYSLINMGIIRGYEDKTFKPEKNIMRAEFAILADRLLNDYLERKYQAYEKSFISPTKTVNPECSPEFVDPKPFPCAEVILDAKVLADKQIRFKVVFENLDEEVVLSHENLPDEQDFRIEYSEYTGDDTAIMHWKPSENDDSYFYIIATNSAGKERNQLIDFDIFENDVDDIDEDGTADFYDDCIYDFGRPEAKGCPDKVIKEYILTEQEADVSLEIEGLDADSVVLRAEDVPEGATFTDLGDAKAHFIWQTEASDMGSYEIYVYAKDKFEKELIYMLEVNVDCDYSTGRCAEDYMDFGPEGL